MKLLAVPLLLCASACAQAPYKVYVESRITNAPMLFGGSVSMMAGDRAGTVRWQFHHSCHDLVADAPVVTLADYLVVMKDRGADLLAKDGTLLLHSNARSEHKNGIEFCKYFAGLPR